MILSCSACSTRYLVDPTLLGPEGRVVRCAKCGHHWMQKPPEDLPKQVEPPPLQAEPRPIPRGSNLPALPRQPAPTGALGWVALAVIVAGVLGGGVVAREKIVAAWPPAAKLYKTVGLPVEPLSVGLELRNMASSRRVVDGVPVLIIEGEVANVSNRVLKVPKLRAALRNAKEHEIRRWTFSAARTRLMPGESVSFMTRVEDPPQRATGLAITFVSDG
jgi:predicted Zn finger-like uncharacterized protein